MTYYVCVAAVRIQTWIARTPKLTLMRGASIALHEVTRVSAGDDPPTEVEQLLKRLGIRRCAEAGEVDGVVVLEHADKAKAKSAALEVLMLLRSALPALEWEVWGQVGDTYFDAYAKRNDPGAWKVSLPSSSKTLGLVQSCAGCRAEVASRLLEPVVVEDEPDQTRLAKQLVGSDCEARHRAQSDYRTRQKAQRTGDRDRWTSWSDIPGKWPKHFEELSVSGGQPSTQSARTLAIGRGDSTSHLATIAADGNSVGLLFDVLRANGLGDLSAKAAAWLTDTTREAVIRAATSVTSDWDDTEITVKVVLPHYVGGDDVLVTVPAWAAWRFAVALANHFETLREALTSMFKESQQVADDTALARALEGVSLGVGIVFAHRTHPFAETQQLAHEALRAAKKSTQGKYGAIGWFDLTEDSSAVNPRVITLQSARLQLGKDLSARPEVFNYSPSARSQLGKILRDHADRSSGVSAGDDLAKKLTQWATRTHHDPDKLPKNLWQLEDLLSRARWWPDKREIEDEQPGALASTPEEPTL